MTAPKSSNKVIITCAITGGIHTPTMSDALPCTPSEIAEQAIAAAEAGGVFQVGKTLFPDCRFPRS